MSAAIIATQTSDPWSRLRTSAEWAILTEPQQVWVTQFLATGSAVGATRTAYKATSTANARILSYEIAKNPKIIAALDIASGRITPPETGRELLIKLVRKQLKKSKPGSTAASTFTLQLERLLLGGQIESEDASEPQDEFSLPVNDSPKIEEPRGKFYVGQLVTQRSDDGVLHTGRILALDANGTPSKFEEVL